MSIPGNAKTVSRQEPRRLRTRAALLSAGLKLLADRPVDGISVDDIVRQAGVAKGSFFNHFADKDEFAVAIAADIRSRVEARVDEVNGGVTDPALRLVRGICCFVRFALAERPAAKIFSRVHTPAIGSDHPLNAGLRADFAWGLADKRFSAVSVDAGLVYVIGIAHGLLAAVIARKLDAARARVLSADVLSLLLTGLAVDPLEAQALAASAAASVIAGPASGR